LKLTEGLGLTENGIEVSGFSDWKEQRAVTAGRGIVRVLAGYGEMLEGNNRSLFGQTSLLDFCKSPSGTLSSPPVLLDTGDDDPYDTIIVVA
jgi:hypothetical protein